MKYAILLILLLSLKPSLAQQSLQNTNWMIGATPVGPNASQTPGPSLNFINCAPDVEFNSAGNQYEGQTSISDNVTGALLFYSNGNQVRNALGQIMPNGNLVGITNSQAQNLIVKQPGGGTTYYLFTPETQAGVFTNTLIPGLNGFSYSVIDMSLNGGLGGVVSSANLLMPLGNCEMVTGVYHQNGQDIWIIGHQYASNTFFAFLLTASGITSTPILSSVGPTILTFQPGVYANSNYDAIGELKASPDGNKLAFTTFYNGYTCLLDFNNATGDVTNPIELNLGMAGYGTSFSQDNSKLYFSRVDETQGGIYFLNTGSIVQFDLSSNNPTTIQNSMTEIFSSATGYRSLKLGPDGKIYVARTTLSNGGNGASYLGVINNPNASGLACNFVNDGVFIGAGNGRWGLNNAIENFFACEQFVFSLGPDLTICQEDSITISAPPNELAYMWNTGETTSEITVNQPGTYWVTVTSTIGTATDTIVVNNFVEQSIFITGQTEICIGETTTLSASAGFSDYEWNNGAQSQSIVVGAGNYVVTAIDSNGCISSNALAVFEVLSTVINFVGDTIVCSGETTTLSASAGFSDYSWNNGAQSQAIVVGAGNYVVTAIDSNGCVSSNAIAVFEAPVPVIAIVGDTIVCVGETTALQVNDGFQSYFWSNGETVAATNVGAGVYQVTVTDSLGCEASAEISVISSSPVASIAVSENPVNGEGTVTSFQSTSVEDLTPIVSWSWNFGDGNVSDVENPTHSFDEIGTYQITLIITDTQGCVDTTVVDLEVIEEIVIPNVVTPNGDGVNDVFMIQNLDKNKSYRLVVLNRWGNVVFEVDDYQNDWVPSNLVDGVYFYEVFSSETEKYAGFFTVFSGEK